MDAREMKKIALILLLDESLREEEKNKKKRQKVVRNWIKRRRERGVFATLLQELRLEDPSSYRNWLRMDEPTFLQLVSLTENKLKKKSLCQDVISVQERVAITLRYLATGTTFKDLAFEFRVGERTVSRIVFETCSAISGALNYTFEFPTSTEEWKQIGRGFQDRWNFPHCLGAIDGKHIVIRKPISGGSHYHNYKGTDSIVLMAVVDANLQFRYIDVGTNGRVSDGGVWGKCRLAQLLEGNEASIPSPETIQGTDVCLPYVFVADDAFPLKPYLLKPYSGSNLTRDHLIFNYRLSRARRCVESAFGILASRFRIFLRPINVQPEKVKLLVMAACCLHNYLKINNSSIYSPSCLYDVEDIETGEILPGEWRDQEYLSFAGLAPTMARNPSAEAKAVREGFTKYFVSKEGCVYWQWARV